jgi:hypothetical protein
MAWLEISSSGNSQDRSGATVLKRCTDAIHLISGLIVAVSIENLMAEKAVRQGITVARF